MAFFRVYSVGRLAKYLTESSFKTLRSNTYRSSARSYNTEKVVEAEADKQATIKECQKQIATLTSKLGTLNTQVKDFEDKYKRYLEDDEIRRRMMKQEDAKSLAIQNVLDVLLISIFLLLLLDLLRN